MFKIGQFVSEIQTGGVLRTNRFLVTFNAPAYLQGDPGATNDTMTIRCESVQMPGLSFASIDGPPRPGYGPIESTPFSIAFDDITLTFIVDARGDVHKFFYRWFNSIVNFHSRGQKSLKEAYGPVRGMKTYEVGYKDSYSTDLNITVYDTSDNKGGVGRKIMTAKVYRAFPKLLPSFDLSWGSNDEFVRLAIPFTYTDFEVEYFNAKTAAVSKPINIK